MKAEREKKIYINAYIWNLERWYWWTYLKGSNWDTDIENRLTDKGGGEEGEGDTEEEHGKMYTNICRIDSSGNFLYDSGNSNQGSVTM